MGFLLGAIFDAARDDDNRPARITRKARKPGAAASRPSAPKPPKPPTSSGTEEQLSRDPTVTVLFAAPGPIDRARLQAALENIAPGQARIGEIMGMPAGGEPMDTACRVTIRGQPIDCLGIDAPAPGLDEMIQTTRSEKPVLAPLRAQQRHVLCFARTPTDGFEATLALYQLAAAFADQGALGIIHTSAWQCMLSANVRKMVDADAIATLRQGAFRLVWCNLIPFHGERGIWWATKGNHVFGSPDFAFWDQGKLKPDQIRDLLHGLVDHVAQGAVIKHGENIQFGTNLLLRAGPVTEFADSIAGPGETIALRLL
jgi:hypothetical protein